MTAPETAPAERHMGEGLPEGMVPWAGGDAAPADWDGGLVLLADGEMLAHDAADPFDWTHVGGELGCLECWCIVAYTPKAATPTALPSAGDALREAIARVVRVAMQEEFLRGTAWETTGKGRVAQRYAEGNRAADAILALQSPRASDEVLGEASGLRAEKLSEALERIRLKAILHGQRDHDGYCDIQEIAVSALNADLAALSASPVPVDTSGTDAARLEYLASNSYDLRCFDVPTGGDDYDIGWRVVGHWMAEPRERTIAEVFHDDPRAVIDAARNAADTPEISHTAPVADAQAGEGK